MPTKVHLVKAMVFPVVMYGCESQKLKPFEAGHFVRDEEAPERDSNLTEDYS